MKLVHPEIEEYLIREEDTFVEWIIEEPCLFAKYAQELLGQCDGKEGEFILSHKDKEVSLEKKAEMVVNPFIVNINEKKILNKLYLELKNMSVSENMYIKTQEMNQRLNEYLLELEHQMGYILDIDPNIDYSMLFKAAGIQFETLYEELLGKLVSYIKIVREILSVELFIFVNIRSFLSKEQLEELLKEAEYQEIKILFMENTDRGCVKQIRRYIIDSDNCVIY